MQLTTDQKNAYDSFFRFLTDPKEKCFVLSGYSGTGKSTLINAINEKLQRRFKTLKLLVPELELEGVYFTATTNKAAENLREIVYNNVTYPLTDVCTIHKLLKFRLHKNFKTGGTSLVASEKEPVPRNSLIFIDEASYIDSDLLSMILTHTEGSRIVFIGDPAQLLAVGAKESPVFDAGFPEARLETIVRQADGNPIQDLSNKFRELVNTGNFFSFTPDGTSIQHIPDKQVFDQEVLKEFSRPDWEYKDSKVLAWTNKAVRGFNDFIRSHVKGSPEINAGDYVVVNNYIEVNNTTLKTDEVVKVTSKWPAQEFDIKGVRYKVSLQGGTKYVYVFVPDSWEEAKETQKLARKIGDYEKVKKIDSWGDLRATYSCTINKSQGSTFDKVFIDLDDLKRCGDANQLARLLYVGATRARNHVIFTGDLV